MSSPATGTPLAAPRFTIGETVFLRESASLGFLESYKVSSVAYSKTGEPVYLISIEDPKVVSPSFGDQNLNIVGMRSFGRGDLGQLGRTLNFLESELIDLCEASQLVRNNLLERLERIDLIVAGNCPDVTV